MTRLDDYDLRARLTPGYLVLSPTLVGIVLLTAEHLSLLTAMAALLVGLGVPFVLASIVRDRGKALEPSLWRDWGGAPATAMLRATSDDVLSEERRRRARDRTGATLPSAVAQNRDPEKADRDLQQVVNLLIKQTRDDVVIQSELGDYGMRRNLLGVRDLGLLNSALTTGLGVGDVVWDLIATSDAAASGAGTIVVGVLAGFAWMRMSASWVRIAADRYANALLA